VSLIYRGLWNDDRAEFVRSLEEDFGRWLKSKGVGIGIVRDGTSEYSRFGRLARVSHRSLIKEDLEVVEIELLERHDKTGSKWITRLSAVSETSGGGTILVDVERTSPNAALRIDLRAPSLVGDLFASGLNPRSSGVSLSATSAHLAPAKLAAEVADATRAVSLIVFGEDSNLTAPENRHRENIAAERLAGAVQVYHLKLSEVANFSKRVGPDESVAEGDVRLFFPNAGGFPGERGRSRSLQREDNESMFAAADRFGGLLLSVATARGLPDRLERGLEELRRASAGTAAEYVEVAEALVRDNESIILDLRQQVASLEIEYLDAQIELEAEISENARRREQFASVLRSKSGTEDSVDESLDIEPRTIEEAVECAREFLKGVVIPAGVEHDLKEMESNSMGRVWAQGVWQGLRALSVYAGEGFDGDFRQWCASGHHMYSWSVSQKKLAMRESESTESSQKFRDQRTFPIAHEVSESGKEVMVAHLKISAGGSPLIPRIYFYDDTRGSTGSVHIGYIGPHKYLENTRTN
jgi:hypothetical protein